jgi:hypothetical protein
MKWNPTVPMTNIKAEIKKESLSLRASAKWPSGYYMEVNHPYSDRHEFKLNYKLFSLFGRISENYHKLEIK